MRFAYWIGRMSARLDNWWVRFVLNLQKGYDDTREDTAK